MVAQNDDQNASMILYKLLLTIHKRAGFKTSMLQNHKKIFIKTNENNSKRLITFKKIS